MDIEIQFRGVTVGFVRGTVSDMWYLEGDWDPVSSVSSKSFLDFLETANLRENMLLGAGMLVKRREVGTKDWGDGLVLGCMDGRIMIRMLNPDTAHQFTLRK